MAKSNAQRGNDNNTTRNLILASMIGGFLGIFYILLPSVLEPTVWTNPTPLLSFEGPTEANDILSYATKIEGDFSGPESLAIDSETGIVYVSFSDGTVGSFSEEGKLIRRVFFTGGFVSALEHNGNGLSQDKQHLLKWCNQESLAKRLAWDTVGERKCGRPLGLRLRSEQNGATSGSNDKTLASKYLYILDAYHGLFKLNLVNSSAQHLITPSTPITPPPGEFDHSILNIPKFYNDLDITHDGVVLFTDTSTKFTRSENRQEILDAAPRGRLFRFDQRALVLSVLVCGLHFPNGVQLLPADPSSKEEEVLVNELSRFRTLKINISNAYLHGIAQPMKSIEPNLSAHSLASCLEFGSLYSVLNEVHKGDRYRLTGIDYFIENMPGLPDNVRSDVVQLNGQSYYLFGLGSKSTQPFSLLWFAYQSWILRDVVGKLLPMQWVEKLVPSYGLVLVSDADGRIVNSLHDPSGGIRMISQANRHPRTGDLWLGSHSEALAILSSEYVPKSWL